jgi:hypothetical protein
MHRTLRTASILFLVLPLALPIASTRVARALVYSAPAENLASPEPKAHPKTRPAPLMQTQENTGAKHSTNTPAGLYLECEFELLCFINGDRCRGGNHFVKFSYKVDLRNNTVTFLGRGTVSANTLTTETIEAEFTTGSYMKYSESVTINRITGQGSVTQSMQGSLSDTVRTGSGQCMKVQSPKF